MPGGVHNAEENMEKSIEQIFSELDQILEKLEAADTSLEDSFACYEAGMKLVRSCRSEEHTSELQSH